MEIKTDKMTVDDVDDVDELGTDDVDLIFSAQVHGLQLTLLIDTGSRVNLLAYEAYLQLNRVVDIPMLPAELLASTVTGHKVELIGKIPIKVTLGGKLTFTTIFYVMKGWQLPPSGLIGLRLLRKLRLHILPDEGELSNGKVRIKALPDPPVVTSVSSISVPLNTLQSPPTQSAPPLPTTPCATPQNTPSSISYAEVPVLTAFEQRIPARHFALLYTHIPKTRQGQDIIMDNSSIKIKGLTMESSWDKVREGNRSVALVTNNTGSTITLGKGTFLGVALVHIHPIKEMDEVTLGMVRTNSHISEGDEDNSAELHVDVEDFVEHKQQLETLLRKYRKTVALHGEPLGFTHLTQHHIHLKPGTQPIYTPAYRIPHSRKAMVHATIEEMLSQGIIQPSMSPWNSPLFLIPKKDGTFRPVIDFRKVNTVTEPDRSPMPVMSEILQSLGGGNKVFSTLDLKSSFWQLGLTEESKPITAFSTDSGHYEFVRMPFGLRNAPITFQRLMNSIFGDMIGSKVYVYLDDFVIFSKDVDSHLEIICEVLERLTEAGLKLQLAKCTFMKAQIKFLGHLVDVEGIHVTQDKISAIQRFPVPKNADQVRSFVGLAGYFRHFVKNFAKRAAPLTKFARKGVPFIWSTEENDSFEELKHALTTAPILAFPDFKKPFLLYTDASTIGIGAVLQQQDEAGKLRVVGYASRILNPTEANYSVTHLEALAVVWGLKHFRDLILGYEVHVYTDHQPVIDLFKGKALQGKIARWHLTILEYNPTLHYVKGKANVVADALSRNVQIAPVNIVNTVSPDQLRYEQRQDPIWKHVIYSLESGDTPVLDSIPVPMKQFYLDNGILCRKVKEDHRQQVIPSSLIPNILHMIHDSPIAGHPGRDKNLTNARKSYYWPTMRVDITNHIQQCVQCAQVRGTIAGPSPMQEFPIPSEPWETAAIDLLKLPRSHQGSSYVLVAVDYFSKYAILVPLAQKTADVVAKALVDNVFCKYNIPKTLLSDNGTEFKNEVVENVCKIYKIDQCFTTAYHPQGNGLVERTNRKILEVLRPLVGQMQDTWEDWLPQVQASINGSINAATTKTPHYIVFGQDLRLPYDILNGSPPPLYNVEDYAQRHAKVFHQVHSQVRKHLKSSRAEIMAKQHRRAKPLRAKQGDVVMKRPPFRNSKLDPKFEGPLVVAEVLGNNKYKVIDPKNDSCDVVHADRLRRVKCTLDTDTILRRTGFRPAHSTSQTSSRPVSSQTRRRPRPSSHTSFHMNLRSRR